MRWLEIQQWHYISGCWWNFEYLNITMIHTQKIRGKCQKHSFITLWISIPLRNDLSSPSLHSLCYLDRPMLWCTLQPPDVPQPIYRCTKTFSSPRYALLSHSQQYINFLMLPFLVPLLDSRRSELMWDLLHQTVLYPMSTKFLWDGYWIRGGPMIECCHFWEDEE